MNCSQFPRSDRSLSLSPPPKNIFSPNYPFNKCIAFQGSSLSAGGGSAPTPGLKYSQNLISFLCVGFKTQATKLPRQATPQPKISTVSTYTLTTPVLNSLFIFVSFHFNKIRPTFKIMLISSSISSV